MSRSGLSVSRETRRLTQQAEGGTATHPSPDRSETDAAAFYCPYIPLMSSGVVLDPQTFEPVVSFRI